MKNNNDIKVMLKEAGILFAITLIAGLVLGFVYEITKEPIRKQQELAIVRACQAVFADASTFDDGAYSDWTAVVGEETIAEFAAKGVEVGTIFAAKDASGNVLGCVIESTTHEGYGGDIVLYVGVRNDGTLNGISLLEISETPGLGMQAEDVLVPQFAGKQVESFTYTKTGSQSDSEIDAISGATVTTEAVTNAVNAGLEVSAKLMEGGTGNE